MRRGKLFWPVAIALALWAWVDSNSANLYALGLVTGVIFAPLFVVEAATDDKT